MHILFLVMYFDLCMQIVTVISNTLALLQGCKEANKTVGCATVLSSISDVKSWLLPCTDQLYNHSHPHIFKFNKGSRVPISTEMHYKRWNEDKWEPEGQPGLKLLKVPAGRFEILICLIYIFCYCTDFASWVSKKCSSQSIKN